MKLKRITTFKGRDVEDEPYYSLSLTTDEMVTLVDLCIITGLHNPCNDQTAKLVTKIERLYNECDSKVDPSS